MISAGVPPLRDCLVATVIPPGVTALRAEPISASSRAFSSRSVASAAFFATIAAARACAAVSYTHLTLPTM